MADQIQRHRRQPPPRFPPPINGGSLTAMLPAPTRDLLSPLSSLAAASTRGGRGAADVAHSKTFSACTGCQWLCGYACLRGSWTTGSLTKREVESMRRGVE